MPNIWINTTTTHSWFGAFVGISRVENELSKHLSCKKFYLYQRKNFIDNTHDYNKKQNNNESLNKQNVINKAIGFVQYATFIPGKLKMLRIIGLSISLFYGKNKTIDKILNNALTHTTPIWMYLSRTSEKRKSNKRVLNSKEIEITHPFGEQDVVISLGLDWDNNSFEKLIEIKKSTGIRLITAIYDLVPINNSQYIANEKHAVYLLRHFTLVCLHADVIIVNSNYVKLQVLTLMENLGLPQKRIEILPWGPMNKKSKIITSENYNLRKKEEDYFLMIGTIEIRKNHRIICSTIYLAHELGISIPKFVFVGRRGWGTSDLISEIMQSPILQEKIVWLENVNDGELETLLSGCLGLVSPSFDEGFGLPVLDALNFGKRVYLSNIPIYRELFPQGIFASPHDSSEWLENLTKENSESNPETFLIKSWESISLNLNEIATSLIV